MTNLKGTTKQRNGDKESKIIVSNIGNNKCDYGCGKPAKYYFKTADVYCCESNFRKCSHQKELTKIQALMRNAGSKRQVALGRIERGELNCVYCGNTAKHMISGYRGCCEKYAKQCSGYSKFIGDNIRQAYIDDPSKHEKMTKAMLEAQNRPEVIEKKRQSMNELHNGDCILCKEFQHNYEEGRNKHRDNLDERITKELKDMGIVPPNSMDERAMLLKKIKYQLREESYKQQRLKI